MIKKFFIFSILFVYLHSDELKVNVTASANSKMQIIICPLDESENLKEVANALNRDFQISRQFDSRIEKLENPYSKKTMKELWNKSIPFVLFLKYLQPAEYEWRLYDTGLSQMISGKKIESEMKPDFIGHKIADQVWPLLTGKNSSFSCPIVGCKKINISNKKSYKYIYSFYLSDFLDQHKKPNLIVDAPTLNIAPRWHSTKPLLYFSQHTPVNVRLVVIDESKKQRVVTNFDGLNMTPAISEEGSIVISLTKNGFGRLCKYFFDEKRMKGIFRSITPSDIHAISPSFINENEIVFCHIKNRIPRIAKIDLKTNKIDYLTESYSVSPIYCKANNCVAYCQRVDGISQIFSYNLEKKEHKQLTKDSGDKDECCWSPCGNFIVFSSEDKNQTRTCVLNVSNDEVVTVSPKNESWSFPSWSPNYNAVFCTLFG